MDLEQKISRVTTAKQCCTGFRRFCRVWKDADGWWKAVDTTSLITGTALTSVGGNNCDPGLSHMADAIRHVT